VKTGPRKTPGVGLIALLAAVAICWAAAARIAHPIAREAGDQPSARAVKIRHRLPDMRIELNQATEAELMLLPGIGPRLAEGIVADRAANGPYRRLEDLTRVRWIGPVVVERIAPYVVVDTAAASADRNAPHR
jgi:competence ComEA-like helix-hairpin-helix protein